MAWPELLAVALLGLCVGSFLNVVIFRLPLMVERRWRKECAELLGQPPPPEERFDLLFPSSRCPSCRAPIKPWHNIPILSYLWLRGRCASCGTPISPRYPVVEGLTALLSLLVALSFEGWALAGALLFTWLLIALSFIDLDWKLLPDDLTLPGLWLGLLFNLKESFAPLESAVIGAVSGYLFLWLFYHLFRLATGKEGMGYGDFKLAAMLGAWLGWQKLPLVLLLSSLSGALLGSLLLLTGRLERDHPLPFGPFLAVAGWIALLWGERIVQGYLKILS